MNNLTKVREGFDGVNRTTTYTYDKDNRVTGVSQSDTSEAYTYDDYGRFRKAALTHGENLTIEDIYTYQAPTDTTTAMQVYKQTTKINGAESAYRYTYDANGNITSVNDGTYTTTYVYDSADQLLRENNEKAGKTWGWTYDDGGNIRTKTEYAYTTGTVGEALDTVTYNYSASSWGDLLISHDGNTIVSDDSGNMLSYGDAKTFTWKHGRELSGMTDDSGSWTFEYNADGLRVYRSNGTTTYKYYYNGDKLTRMVVNGENITFGYDANSAPQYVIYGGHRYFYLTNLQGDVTSIITVGGTTVVEYTYDAWGNILTVTGSMANTLGKANPLHYRGYVYDEETGLYYLQSRYYDPQIGRFINADGYTSTGQGFVGNNMFAYCNNNPISNSDSSGKRCVAVSDVGGGIPVTTPQIAPTPTEQIRGVINGQNTLPYSDVKIGLGSYGKSGCAYIATYNAMQLIGQPQSLANVTSEMFWSGAVAFGAGGAGPWATSSYFTAHGISYTGSFSANNLVTDISEGSVITFTALYPTGWHAMTALYTNGKYSVFNRFDNASDAKTYTSLSEAYPNGRWIYGFRIDP